MKILATGGGGLLGRYVIRKLISYGFEVKGFDLFPPPHEFSKIDWVQGDIRDSNKVDDAVKGVDAVFHLAGRDAPMGKKTRRKELI
jgi:Nucleoside-diphosphate-sugar epimerases